MSSSIPASIISRGILLGSLCNSQTSMTTTLYDIIDTWTMKWDRGVIESVLKQVAAPFYKFKLSFFLLEEIWDALEFIDDPLEFMTEKRKIQQIENLLGYGKIERAAKFVKLEVVESPELKITVLNAEETIAKNPGWFEPWEGMTLSGFGDKLLEDDK